MIARKDFGSGREPDPDRESAQGSGGSKSAILKELLAIAELCPSSPFIELVTNSKRPKGKSWTSIPSTELSRALQTGGIALVFEGNNLCAFDSDSPESRQLYFEIIGKFPENTPTASWTSGKLIGDTGVARSQVLFAYPDPSTLPEHLQKFVQSRQVVGKNELDYRSGHNYSVLPTFSNHPDTGKPYYWLKHPSEVGIRELTVEQIQKLYELASKKSQSKKSADKETKAQRNAFVAELVRKYSERKAEFNNGNLTTSDLSPSEYFDWIAVPKAGWKAAIGYGSNIGFKKKGKHWYTAPGYRHSESGLSVGVEWHQLKDGSFIYRVTDWLYQNSEQRGYFTGVDFILMRRGVSNPSFSQRVAIVQEIAAKWELPEYSPNLDSGTFTEEQRRQYREQKFQEALGEYQLSQRYPETAIVMQAASIIEAIALVSGTPERVIAIKGVKGCGKSDIVKEFAARLSVATTRSLSYDQAKKYELSHYLTRKTSQQLWTSGETRVLDSLHKLLIEEPTYMPETFVLDEWDSIINQTNTSTTDVAKHRSETRTALTHFARGAKKVVALSADMNGDEVRALEKITGSKVLVIELTIPPQGNTLIPVQNCEAGIQLLLHRINEIGREWLDGDRAGVPDAATVSSDSRRMCSLLAASITHKNFVVEKHGDEDDKEEWLALTQQAVKKLDPDVEEIVEVLLVTAETVTDPEVKIFLSDPSLWIQKKASEGKIAVPIFSPSVREGVSILLRDLPHDHFAFFKGGVLDTRAKAQQIKRDRNPERTFLVPCSSTFTREKRSIVQSREEIRNDLQARKDLIDNDRDFVERVRAEANYRRFRDTYYQATGTSADNATDAEIYEKISAILQHQPEYLTTEMVTDYLTVRAGSSPWLDYKISRIQERQLAFTNEMQNLIDHLITEDGFTLSEPIEFQPEKDDNSAILEAANDSIQATWMQEGFQNHEEYGSEESIRDSLSCDRGINQKEKRILEGSLIPREFPGAALEHTDFEEQVRKGSVTHAGKRLAELRNPKFLKYQLSKRAANRINKGLEQAIVTDDDETRKRALFHRALAGTTYLKFLAAPAMANRELGYSCETPELVELVDSCRKHQRLFKKVGLTVPAQGNYDQYVQFVGRIHSRMGLCQRAAKGKRVRQFTEGDTPYMRAYYVPNLSRAFTMCAAYETYLASKEATETSRVAKTRGLAQLVKRCAAQHNDYMINGSADHAESQTHQGSQPSAPPAQLSIFDAPHLSAPEGAPERWAIGTRLRWMACATHYQEEIITLVEWLFHSKFGIWTVLAETQNGKQIRVAPGFLTLA